MALDFIPKKRRNADQSASSSKTSHSGSESGHSPKSLRRQNTGLVLSGGANPLKLITAGNTSESARGPLLHNVRAMRESVHYRDTDRCVDLASPKVCVCQPDPKIPRPRNAWILYRQHHQASVVAQYPGLSEPEISKILGDYWRNQPNDVKDSWKQVAEEEKIRHQQTYPDYRYQPRRKGRNNGSIDSPSTDLNAPCAKCGGVNMISPTTPLGSGPPRPILPPPSTVTQIPIPQGRGSLSIMNGLSLDSPDRRDSRHYPPNINVPPLRQFSMDNVGTTASPDAKRRRFTSAGGYVPIANPPNGGQTYAAISPYTRDVFARPDTARRTSPPLSGPIIQNGRIMHPHQQSQRQESLTLPPMQNANGTPRTTEELVMAMNFVVKIRTLGRIAPPLKAKRPTWPVRGSIIAIEGDDSGAVHSLTTWLEETLTKTGEHTARIAKGPEAPENGKRVSFKDYLAYMETWHDKSKEMIDYITHFQNETDAVVDRTEAMEDDKTPTGSSPRSPTPVLILKHYHLFASNAYACRIPITDTYFPNDHWQWMATVWRGVVGPDYTIYIKDATPEEMAKEKAVEVKEDARCIIVRREKGPGPLHSVIGEKRLRRLAFEVDEVVRVVAEGKGEGKEGNGEDTRGKR
ncbi:MAG: hypothetical protein M1828_004048 [Chrysothrix sp. TS-e1954]|nr:MAG: hypothetical protein M1828_004048 [Chrysothrix sp. TS-e1954]